MAQANSIYAQTAGALDTTATIQLSQVVSLPQRFAGPQPVGTRSNHLTGGRVALTTTGNTYRAGHVIYKSCANLRGRMRNDYAGGWGETPNTDTIDTMLTLEFPIGSLFAVTFAGKRILSIPGGAVVDSDPTGICVNADITGTVLDSSGTGTTFNTSLTCFGTQDYSGQIIKFTSGALVGQFGIIAGNTTAGRVTMGTGGTFRNPATIATSNGFATAPAAGDQFIIIPVVYSRTYAGPVGGSGTANIPVGLRGQSGATTGMFEGYAASFNAVDSGSFGGTTNGIYSPAAILGDPLAGSIVAVYVGGDSIAAGTGSAITNVGQGSGDAFGDRGFIVQALEHFNIPYVRGSKAGELSTNFQNIGSNTFRKVRMAAARGCRYAILNYGTNDRATRTAAEIKASILEITAAFNKQGTKVYWCTIDPATTSTDSWSTTTNQTLQGTESTRTALNDWLRDMTASGYVSQAGGSSAAGLFDTAAVLEVNSAGVQTLDGGYYKTGTRYDSGTSSATSTTALTDGAKAWTTNQHVGRFVASLSGSTFTMAEIQSNTGTVLTINNWSAGTPTSGAAYQIYSGYTIDGIHPSQAGHDLKAAVIQAAVAAGALS